jgi:hypothetical protein
MTRPITIAAVYSPPRHTISCQEYEDLLFQLGPHFLVAGDWNSKHTAWGSRLTTPKGRNLQNVIQQNNFNYMSTGEPTYWPTDLNKIPDLLDFAITKGISDIYSSIKSNLDMSSDHNLIVITLSNHVIWKKPPIQLYNRDTNWTQFQDHINNNINLNLQLKVNQDLEDAVDHITQLIQTAAWTSTPNREKTLQDAHNHLLQSGN